jgi:uncharacterized protein involved in exopolysaccharide biosynthesis
MFSVKKPQVDPALLAETMLQWKKFWLLPAGMAAGVLLLFAVAFFDTMKRRESQDGPATDGE